MDLLGDFYNPRLTIKGCAFVRLEGNVRPMEKIRLKGDPLYLIRDIKNDPKAGILTGITVGFWHLFALALICLFAIPAVADSDTGMYDPVATGRSDLPEAGLTYLLDLCDETSEAALDFSKVDPVVNFILKADELSSLHLKRGRRSTVPSLPIHWSVLCPKPCVTLTINRFRKARSTLHRSTIHNGR